MEYEWNCVTDEEEIERYFESEIHYMPTKNYYHDPHNLNIRKLAVSVISKYWRILEIDAFVPYLAMSYFDNFVSQSYDPFLDIDEIRLIATSCLYLAATLRSFPWRSFLGRVYDDFQHKAIQEMAREVEYKILCFMRPVTPFCFLEFYYPKFKGLGQFKRSTINKIIILAQGENDFVDCKYSDIAFSTFLAATHILYPKRNLVIDNPDGVIRCDEKLYDLCMRNGIGTKNIGFQTAPTSRVSRPIIREKSEVVPNETDTEPLLRRPGKEVAEASESDRKRKVKGKAVMVEPEKKKEEKKDDPEKNKEEKKVDPLKHCPDYLMDFPFFWPRHNPFSVKEPKQDSSKISIHSIID